ncbi:MAG: hypothetical protein HQL08_14575, partial [Nitrospirae bacterium]|nr:hypothetical protein [Nitrospirota bacterium]
MLQKKFLSLAVVSSMLVLVPSTAQCDLAQFVPRLYNFHGFLEMEAFRDVKDDRISGTGSKSSDTIFAEKLSFSAEGFIYHPRFAKLDIAISGNFSQEQQEQQNTQGGSVPWSNSMGIGYDVHLKILPEHPYNLELFSLRGIGFSPGGTQSGQQTNDQYGAIFTYYETPYSLNATYILSSEKSDKFSSDSPSLIVFGGHSADFTTTSLLYQHMTSRTDFTTSASLNRSDTTKDDYNLSNTLKYRNAALASSVNLALSDQKTVPSSSDVAMRFLSWNESMTWRLPWNFHSSFTFSRIATSMNSKEEGTDTSTSNTSYNKGFSVGHQLFESLQTEYTMSFLNDQSSDNARSNGTSQGLTVTYIKKIPGGSMNISLVGGDTVESRNGTIVIIGEPHAAKLSAPDNQVVLGKTSVQLSTIVVKVRIPGTETVYELPNTYYLVTMKGLYPVVTIYDLPSDPPVKQIDPNFNYSFTVSYSLVPDNVKLHTSQKGYAMHFVLFDNFLAPFYQYSSSRQKVLAGTLNGTPSSSENTTFGVTLNKWAFSLSASYSNSVSTLSPSRQFLSELSFSNDIGGDTSLRLGVRYMKTSYLAGSESTTGNYNEVDKAADAIITRKLPLYNLYASLTASYGTAD